MPLFPCLSTHDGLTFFLTFTIGRVAVLDKVHKRKGGGGAQVTPMPQQYLCRSNPLCVTRRKNLIFEGAFQSAFGTSPLFGRADRGPYRPVDRAGQGRGLGNPDICEANPTNVLRYASHSRYSPKTSPSGPPVWSASRPNLKLVFSVTACARSRQLLSNPFPFLGGSNIPPPQKVLQKESECNVSTQQQNLPPPLDINSLNVVPPKAGENFYLGFRVKTLHRRTYMFKPCIDEFVCSKIDEWSAAGGHQPLPWLQAANRGSNGGRGRVQRAEAKPVPHGVGHGR